MKKNPLYASNEQYGRPSGNDGLKKHDLGRSAFRKDYARLLHAPSFRRLQGKTQLFPGSESDFFRNRLTHSLEVAQIARGIAAKLNKSDVPKCFKNGSIDEDLIEFASIAHDLGHPPFGHNGEHALDQLMREHGGFEGNAQTLRILASVEEKLVQLEDGTVIANCGLDLTYRSLAAVLKYDTPIPKKRKENAGLCKGYFESEAALVQEIKKRVAPKLNKNKKFKTIECAIMDIADDIAYSTYDLEDSLHGGFVTPLGMANALVNNAELQDAVIKRTNKALIGAGHSKIKSVAELLEIIVEVFGICMPPVVQEAIDTGVAINAKDALIINLESWRFDKTLSEDGLARTRLTAERVGRLISAVDFVPNEKFPQLSGVRMKRQEMLQVEVLKHLNYELVIRSSRLAVVEHRGKEVIEKIFTALVKSDGEFLPPDWRVRYTREKIKSRSHAMRTICDYVACMTDRYAAELYQRLFDEGPTIFKPL